MDIYDRINGMLATKRITKRKLCLDLDMPYTTLASMFQRRSTSIDIEMVKKIARYFDTTLEYLITGEKNYTPNADLSYPCNTITAVTEHGQMTYYLDDETMEAILTILNKTIKDKNK